MSEGVNICVKFCEVTDELLRAEVLAPRQEVAARKREMVANLTGEPVPEEVTPLDSWLTYLCNVNRLENTRPVPAVLVDAITCNRGATRFLWFLS